MPAQCRLLPVTATDEYIVLIAEFGMRIADFAVIDRVFIPQITRMTQILFPCSSFFFRVFRGFYLSRTGTTEYAEAPKKIFGICVICG